MDREDLKQNIENIFQDEVLSKFIDRNKSYGADDGSDAFFNFRQTGTRIAMNSKIDLDELDTMLLPLFTYTDKHQVALMQHLGKTKECEDRIIDIIVYSFIALAMIKDNKSKGHIVNTGTNKTSPISDNMIWKKSEHEPR